jgi:glycosyltransferase 2 family protein
MMRKRALNILVSIIVAALFIWLAVRNVNLTELWSQIRTVTYYWIPFFVFMMLASHYLRAERWRLLLVNENSQVKRSTLFAGVMLGYVLNNIIPRLGEISRPVYVARQQKMSSSNLIGTIVIERLIDLATMMLLILLAALYLIRDLEVLHQLFGTEEWPWIVYLIIPLFFLLTAVFLWVLYRILLSLENGSNIRNPLLLKIVEKARSFSEGMISVRYVRNWPLFILLTAGIWTGYIIMTYLPFYMMNLQAIYGLGLSDAVVLTMVSSIGVSIPTPAGIGSYHLLMQQSMWLLYEVPLVTALTYATIAHGVTVLAVFITAPVVLWWDKYNTLNQTGVR